MKNKMKNLLYISFIFLMSLSNKTLAQHTFSIVAVDPLTGEIGTSGATCLDIDDLNGEEGALVISDIILNTGAISTQAAWNPINQAAARERMEMGDSPQEIIDWLVANDPAPGTSATRQYGVVDLLGGIGGTPRSAAFTGSSNINFAGDIVGPNYAIQGNILLSQEVLDDMEAGFLNTTGTLADKLMAALQGAKRIGAQTSCTSNQTSSKSAFLRVAKIEDLYSNYGHLSVDLNVSKTDFAEDPIDVLQDTYDFFLANPGTDCASSINTFPYTEGFENGLGDWEQNDVELMHVGAPDFDWVLNSGPTPTSNTGPDQAYEGDNYLFVEASGANVGFPAKRAVLNSPCFELAGLSEVFFTFNYHMFGTNTGNLAVRVNDGTGWETLWLIDGAQGDNWNSAVIDLSEYSGQIIQLRLDSTTGLGERSDVAVDNLRLADDVLTINDLVAFETSLLPNPARQEVTINTGTYLMEQLVVRDINGKVVYSNNKVNNTSILVDISTLNNAVYFVEITTKQGVSFKKLIKE